MTDVKVEWVQMNKQAVPVVRLESLRDFHDSISRNLDAIAALHSSPAVLLVADRVVNSETETVEDVPVTQDYINEIWNASVDALEDARKQLHAVTVVLNKFTELS